MLEILCAESCLSLRPLCLVSRGWISCQRHSPCTQHRVQVALFKESFPTYETKWLIVLILRPKFASGSVWRFPICYCPFLFFWVFFDILLLLCCPALFCCIGKPFVLQQYGLKVCRSLVLSEWTFSAGQVVHLIKISNTKGSLMPCLRPPSPHWVRGRAERTCQLFFTPWSEKNLP